MSSQVSSFIDDGHDGKLESLQNITNVVKAADIMVDTQELHFGPNMVIISTGWAIFDDVTNGHKNSAFDQRCPFIQESELGVDQRFNGMGMNEAGWRNGQLIRFMEDKRNVMAVLQHVVAKSCSAQVAFGTMGAY
ncbi:hypothetical protein Tco_1004438 [Tanacetum coccineum]|uniref:Uncharacterized protein n=1 Tax=Tanacetum coccineum TaxID=301880 RepID=A0ABQ5FC74_9ASTR